MGRRRVAFLTEEDGRVKSSLAEANWGGGNHLRTSGVHSE